MFIGLYNLDDSLYLKCQAKTAAGAPSNADANAVTYRIYDSTGTLVTSGSFGTSLVDSQTGLYKTSAITLSSGGGFAAGNNYTVRIAYAISTNFVETQYFTVT